MITMRRLAASLVCLSACGSSGDSRRGAARFDVDGLSAIQDYDVWTTDWPGTRLYIAKNFESSPVSVIDLSTKAMSMTPGVLVPSTTAFVRDGDSVTDTSTGLVGVVPRVAHEYAASNGKDAFAILLSDDRVHCRVGGWSRSAPPWASPVKGACIGIHMPLGGASVVVMTDTELIAHSVIDGRVLWTRATSNGSNEALRIWASRFFLGASDGSRFWIAGHHQGESVALRVDVASGDAAQESRTVPSIAVSDRTRTAGLAHGGGAWAVTITRFLESNHMPTKALPHWDCRLGDFRQDARKEDARIRAERRLFGHPTPSDCKTRVVAPMLDGRVLQLSLVPGGLEVRRLGRIL